METKNEYAMTPNLHFTWIWVKRESWNTYCYLQLLTFSLVRKGDHRILEQEGTLGVI